MLPQADIEALSKRVLAAEQDAARARAEALQVQQTARAQAADLGDKEDEYR